MPYANLPLGVVADQNQYVYACMQAGYLFHHYIESARPETLTAASEQITHARILAIALSDTDSPLPLVYLHLVVSNGGPYIECEFIEEDLEDEDYGSTMVLTLKEMALAFALASGWGTEAWETND